MCLNAISMQLHLYVYELIYKYIYIHIGTGNCIEWDVAICGINELYK